MLTQFRYYGMALFLIPLILGSAVWALYAYGTQQKLPAGVTISGWNVSGMAYSQFQKQLQEKLQRLNLQQVKLRSSVKEVESRQLTFGKLGMVIHDKELNAALEPLFQGSIMERLKYRWNMRNARLELSITFDNDQLAKAVQQNWQQLYAKKPISAKRIILANDEIQYQAERSALRIDIEKLNAGLAAHVPPIGSLSESGESILMELPIYEQPPPVTLQSLKEQGIKRKIVEFTTEIAASGEGRIYNIRSTAASIQDMLLKPGEIFDFGKVIQKTTADYGYKEAPVIVGGKLVPGIGGGICQVSTTLYNAVLRSGLEVVERRNHSLPIRYVPLGQDATYASGYINFIFRNNTQQSLLIRTLATDTQMTVKLFGDIPDSISYDVQSSIVETITPPIQYVHNPALARGSTVKLMNGKPGYKVETYRYKRENGNLVQKELISTDTYSPEPTLIAVNNSSTPKKPQPTNPPAPTVIEDGIAGPIF
ncbi:VanW family protein [Paenibacillus sp. GP183]|uniref:VanW family protein n=1 Tax=Paenibacillus sp. GP183 TaxID=1882751 RepID=UPI0008977494|nr:VanW family protein [Paenibacillus sp. GP183]SEC35172.1 Vancomycin resistance protein YoaR, contains peptidoglycan-binding and VanW domains [Paenibacillus sp. GP183]